MHALMQYNNFHIYVYTHTLTHCATRADNAPHKKHRLTITLTPGARNLLLMVAQGSFRVSQYNIDYGCWPGLFSEVEGKPLLPKMPHTCLGHRTWINKTIFNLKALFLLSSFMVPENTYKLLRAVCN